MIDKLIWEYGRLETGIRARRNRLTGRLQILLWPAGKWDRKKNYWHNAGNAQKFIKDAE